MVLSDSLWHQPVQLSTPAFYRALPAEAQSCVWRVLGKWAGWVMWDQVNVFVNLFGLGSTQAGVTCMLACGLLFRPFSIVGLSRRDNV